MAGRISGTVKWFSRDKGCGVITPDSGEDIFVSNDRIRSHEFRTLTNGQRVSFLVRETPKGPEADDVVPA
ncbi:MAG: cold shock domain-containing protein [Gammaproteobacteria bacterium]|jgi:CspA family cold shock protein